MMKRTTFAFFCAFLCFSSSNSLLAQSPQQQSNSAARSAASYVELGDQFARSGDTRRAIGAYTVAIDYAPEHAPAYFKRGFALVVSGKYDEAILN